MSDRATIRMTDSRKAILAALCVGAEFILPRTRSI